MSDNNIKLQEKLYWESAGNKSYGDFDKWTRLEKMRKEGHEINMTFIDLLLFQAFMTFVLQIFGRKKTNVRLYKWTSWTFGILFFAFLLLRLMMAVVPSTGFVT